MKEESFTRKNVEDMAKTKYYAVRVGKTPGIYLNWEDCRKQIHGYPGAIYKSFPTEEEAKIFLTGGGMAELPEVEGQPGAATSKGQQSKSTLESLPEIYAFVDGSFQVKKKVYGYGGFLVHHGKKEILQGAGTDEEMASMRNVAGEVLGSMAAIQKAVELGLPEVTIYYDYMGIQMWAEGGWKRNKKGTMAYYEYVRSVRDKIKIHFVKVKGHSGVEGNEEADRLAKEAVGN